MKQDQELQRLQRDYNKLLQQEKINRENNIAKKKSTFPSSPYNNIKTENDNQTLNTG